MIKLGISGCCGKMGKRILDLVLQDKDFQLVCLFERDGHEMVGQKESGLIVVADLGKINEVDVLIDFTSPGSTMNNINACVKYSKAIVIGTTGLTQEQQVKIKSASEKIPIVFSPNMSVGVNLLFSLLKEAASKLSSEYEVSITEAHHIHKKDAPSGTAKKLVQIIKDNGSQNINEVESIREGEITGDHTVTFESKEDIITLSHSAKTRDIFAKGSLVAAKFIIGKKNGLFDMQNIVSSKA